MTNRFINGLQTDLPDDGNVALTENNAVAFASTKSAVLDFFAMGGALRSRSAASKLDLFSKAFSENPLLALKSLFYFRDIRGGQGERETFRTILGHLARTQPSAVRANLPLIAEYGRWDDLFVLVGTSLENDVFALIDMQLALDKQADHPSLLAKWLKSENTSSKSSRALARRTRQYLNMSSRQYRKMLTELRRRINLVETTISKGNWREVDYERVPSKAGLQYRKAFYRHDEERYKAYIEAASKGEAKINTGTLYPYEIVEKISERVGWYSDTRNISAQETATLDTMWKNLPNYFGDNEVRGLVVADVSGSMAGRPMGVSVSLAIYTAERNNGPFAGKYITFSHKPKLISVNTNDTIVQKVHSVIRTGVGYNTSIEAVFDLILATAVRNELNQAELPTHLYVVSDMEFDEANNGRRDQRLFETISQKYAAAGYTMPFLVFWNVDSRNNQTPMSMDQRGFQLVSGCSPSIFTSLLSARTVSAYDLMLEVLNSERYERVRVE